MFKFIGEIFLLYLAYKVIFELIIPAASMTRKANKMMKDVYKQQQDFTAENNSKTSAKKPSSHDDEYIDYEEVK